jgi:hypothetical protein
MTDITNEPLDPDDPRGGENHTADENRTTDEERVEPREPGGRVLAPDPDAPAQSLIDEDADAVEPNEPG